jgi:ClpP class serine protease
VRAPRALAAPSRAPAPLSVNGSTATIRVEGVLTQMPDMMAECYGEPNTTYADLREALRWAVADPAVREIVWSIDSPGGDVDGLFALLDEIEDVRAADIKPMRVLADNAHSAAYGIAAAVGNIAATSRMASFGSVGVASSGFIQGGICGTVVDLTSSDAPEKRPNLATDEGKAVVVRYLDQLAAEFMGTIARGRGVDPASVAEGFGRGASMLANEALRMGLIDAVAPRARANVRTHLTNARTGDSVPIGMSSKAVEPAKPDPEKDDPEQEELSAAPYEETPADETEEDDEDEDEDEDKPADASTLSASERAELTEFRAERAAREATELRALVTDLVALGAETPATAWAKGAPVPRLAAEGLVPLRARVAALRGARPAAVTPGAAVTPPASTVYGELEDFERRDAEKIKDPDARARFVASRLARKQK